MQRVRMLRNLIGAAAPRLGACILLALVFAGAAWAQTGKTEQPLPSASNQPAGKDGNDKAARRAPEVIGKPRGLLMDEVSYCDVAAPCPDGCKLDTAANRCVEQSQ